MFKKLPKYLIIALFIFVFIFSAKSVHAQSSPSLGTIPNQERWVPDSNVTFVGKSASRSGDFLDWSIRNYDWACVTRNAVNNTCNNSNNPLVGFWVTIRNIIYALLIVVVLIAAGVMIATRGRSLTITRFIPRFILIIILITLSYSLVQFLYQIADIIQGFFLRTGEGSARHIISTRDLIFIGFDYKSFTGLRLPGAENDESAFMTLLLVRLTAITYYVMTGILIVRKIILWFFIVLSPLFPLLLFFRPVRNTAKIWIGEFFRWLLYGPLFAIFLNGLVVLWSSSTSNKPGIPLGFNMANVGDSSKIVYPTAVNILIGGPGQVISPTNSANLQDTFALYVVALIMLWVVIILPFILLKIFLDFMGGISLQNNASLRQVWNKVYPGGNPPQPSPQSPTQPTNGAGLAMKIPFLGNTTPKTVNIPNVDYRGMGLAREIPSARSVPSIARIPENAHILQLANISVPKITDIARYEKIIEMRDTSRLSEVSRITNSLERISNPNIISSSTERERYQQVKQDLIRERQKGNVLATSILNASNVVSSRGIRSFVSQTSNISSQYGGSISSVSNQFNTSQASTQIDNTSNINTNVFGEKLKQTKEKEMLKEGKAPSEKTAITTPSSVHLPAVNKVQQVSIEDYEEVKKMWLDTYESSSPPTDLSGNKPTREEWINNDINKINQAISLLNSIDPVRVNDGMDMVSNILPFLMVGGFSKTEIIAYLKAKLEAAKQAIKTNTSKKEEDDTLLERKESSQAEQKHLETQAEINPETEENKLEDRKELGDENSASLNTNNQENLEKTNESQKNTK